MAKQEEKIEELEVVICDACKGTGFMSYRIHWWSEETLSDKCNICEGTGVRFYNEKSGYIANSSEYQRDYFK